MTDTRSCCRPRSPLSGWSEKAIGGAMGRDRASVNHMKRRMKDMLSLPGMYPEAAEAWKAVIDITNKRRYGD